MTRVDWLRRVMGSRSRIAAGAAIVGASMGAVVVSLAQTLTSAESLVGTWVGYIDLERDGLTSPIALEFQKKGEAVESFLIVPAFHGRSPLGPARLAGAKVELTMMTLDYDPQASTLSVRVPAGLIPRYRPRMWFKRSDAPFPLPVRPDPAAPQRQPVWVADVGSPIWADAAFRDGRVVVGADAGRLVSIDAASGSTAWTYRAGGAIRARAVFDGSDVLVQSDDGELHRVDAATGNARWRVRVADKAVPRIPLSEATSRYETRSAAVAVHGRRLFVATREGRLLALDGKSGQRLWEFKAGDSMTTTPAVADGRVYVGSFDHYVYALDESTGAVVWKYDTGEAVTSDVAPAGDRVIVGSRSYELESLDARRGTPQWKNYFWFSWVESSPVVFDKTIYVGSSDAARVSAIDLATGRTVWQTDALGSAWPQPAVTETTVFQSVAGVWSWRSIGAPAASSGGSRWRRPCRAIRCRPSGARTDSPEPWRSARRGCSRRVWTAGCTRFCSSDPSQSSASRARRSAHSSL